MVEILEYDNIAVHFIKLYKAPSEASFKGTEYLTIDLSKGDPILSTQETVNLQFKTKQPNGLLFYSGEGDDYLTISLRDGGVAVGMTLAKGRLDLHIKPVRVRFDDNQWHRIIVHRKVQETLELCLSREKREYTFLWGYLLSCIGDSAGNADTVTIHNHDLRIPDSVA
ncbi:Neurexin-3-alpha [Apis cerana cerana]|uniref:Neurexin-3-alpha n=1 Tax=Apis cerana cerana TaxID=94128 RepID=A0A2A3EP68_APICC|nr:Neurexin-3-alpha [Apis cerana cerana]